MRSLVVVIATLGIACCGDRRDDLSSAIPPAARSFGAWRDASTADRLHSLGEACRAAGGGFVIREAGDVPEAVHNSTGLVFVLIPAVRESVLLSPSRYDELPFLMCRQTIRVCEDGTDSAAFDLAVHWCAQNGLDIPTDHQVLRSAGVERSILDGSDVEAVQEAAERERQAATDSSIRAWTGLGVQDALTGLPQLIDFDHVWAERQRFTRERRTQRGAETAFGGLRSSGLREMFELYTYRAGIRWERAVVLRPCKVLDWK